MNARDMVGKYYIQLEGETVEEALGSFAYPTMEDAMLDAFEELPAGAEFVILDGELQNTRVYTRGIAMGNALAS